VGDVAWALGAVAAVIALGFAVASWHQILTAIRDATRELADWRRRHHSPVELEHPDNTRFWRRGMTYSHMQRVAARGRWLMRHNRLRGWRLRVQRTVVSLASEREAQDAAVIARTNTNQEKT